MEEITLGAKIGTREMQLIENDILLEFKSFCKKNGLHYFLGYGTVIGAVRHKGFIPWDDDIDIYMPRADYQKFRERAREFCETNAGGYDVILPGESAASCQYIKIVDPSTVTYEPLIKKRFALGVWIDVFPLDNFYNDEKKNARYLRRNWLPLRLATFMKCRAAAVGVESSHTGFKKFALKTVIALTKVLRLVVSPQTIYRRVDRRAVRMNSYEENPVYLGNGTLCYGMQDHIDRKVFDGAVDAEFEGVMHPIPKGAHEYLSAMYGEYMQLPPPEQRIAHCTEVYRIAEKTEQTND